MKDTIYLRVSRTRVESMTKSLPDVRRGEIPVKLNIEIDPGAFGPPVLERKVHVTDWREGIDLGDVEFRGDIITEDEAQVIRDRRLAKMRTILESQGYTITAPEVSPGD
jgi:hypothetical protein